MSSRVKSQSLLGAIAYSGTLVHAFSSSPFILASISAKTLLTIASFDLALCSWAYLHLHDNRLAGAWEDAKAILKLDFTTPLQGGLTALTYSVLGWVIASVRGPGPVFDRARGGPGSRSIGVLPVRHHRPPRV